MQSSIRAAHGPDLPDRTSSTRGRCRPRSRSITFQTVRWLQSARPTPVDGDGYPSWVGRLNGTPGCGSRAAGANLVAFRVVYKGADFEQAPLRVHFARR